MSTEPKWNLSETPSGVNLSGGLSFRIERPLRPGAMPRRVIGGVEMFGVLVHWTAQDMPDLRAVRFYISGTPDTAPLSPLHETDVSPFLFYSALPLPSFLWVQPVMSDGSAGPVEYTGINLNGYLHLPMPPVEVTPPPRALLRPHQSLLHRLVAWLKGLFR